MLVSNLTIQIILPVWYEGTRFTTEVWAFWLYSLLDVKSPHREHLKDTLDTRFKLSGLFLMWISRLCYLFFMWNHTFNNGNICKKLWILWNLLIKWEAKLTNLSEIYTYKMRSKVENSQWIANVTPPIQTFP